MVPPLITRSLFHSMPFALPEPISADQPLADLGKRDNPTDSNQLNLLAAGRGPGGRVRTPTNSMYLEEARRQIRNGNEAAYELLAVMIVRSPQLITREDLALFREKYTSLQGAPTDKALYICAMALNLLCKSRPDLFNEDPISIQTLLRTTQATISTFVINERLLYQLAESLLADGKPEEALKDFERVIKMDYEHEVAASIGRAVAHYMLEDYVSAFNDCAHVVSTWPEMERDPRLLTIYGLANYQLGEHEAAIPYLTQAINRGGQDRVSLYRARGLAKEKLGMLQSAEADLKQAAVESGEDASASRELTALRLTPMSVDTDAGLRANFARRRADLRFSAGATWGFWELGDRWKLGPRLEIGHANGNDQWSTHALDASLSLALTNKSGSARFIVAAGPVLSHVFADSPDAKSVFPGGIGAQLDLKGVGMIGRFGLGVGATLQLAPGPELAVGAGITLLYSPW